MATKRPASESAEVTPTEVNPDEAAPVAVAADPALAAPDSSSVTPAAEPVAVEPAVVEPVVAETPALEERVDDDGPLLERGNLRGRRHAGQDTGRGVGGRLEEIVSEGLRLQAHLARPPGVGRVPGLVLLAGFPRGAGGATLTIPGWAEVVESVTIPPPSRKGSST